MLTLNIDNKNVENIFLNEFHSNKDKFIEFIEESFNNLKNQSTAIQNDLSHLESKVDDGLNSQICSQSHKEIFKELKSKYV
ncbi:MAG: hypothetical protein A2513_09605 [Sulfurimonas sp. RIFOXYD12_FULL_33_39]|uniref:hypothetical protein n=1 Tax=unclassified Sulfurimonas TaxID=2623549 RepID=UPI0008C6D279|nr:MULTISPECIES: hypothetical protein [unclassified Sulfurimonas]OHE10701.1 MAG: hypothetical protein A2513_09605 [Sulfurimonas sp. RIFOXYD12_FULL_33_39]OHE13214.1 MAG: hypothetical protein A2530_11195 [Sulfurimonas sp. RIFOXYD2_FULL_34_21]